MEKCRRTREHTYSTRSSSLRDCLIARRHVLSLGELCGEHGYTCEWASGQKPHLTKNGKRILCKTANFVSVVVQGLSLSSSASSSFTSFPQDSSGTSPSPARLQSDDTYYQASGDRGDHSKFKHKNKNEVNNQATGRPIARPPGVVRGVHR